jgi:hypothetical protein
VAEKALAAARPPSGETKDVSFPSNLFAVNYKNSLMMGSYVQLCFIDLIIHTGDSEINLEKKCGASLTENNSA